jgi:hypothetical protein
MAVARVWAHRDVATCGVRHACDGADLAVAQGSATLMELPSGARPMIVASTVATPSVASSVSAWRIRSRRHGGGRRSRLLAHRRGGYRPLPSADHRPYLRP